MHFVKGKESNFVLKKLRLRQKERTQDKNLNIKKRMFQKVCGKRALRTEFCVCLELATLRISLIE